MPKAITPVLGYITIRVRRWLPSCGVIITLALITFNLAQAQTTNYALGTNALFEGAAGGSDSVELTLISSVGTWTVTGLLNIARYYHTAALLTNGMVLVAGGENNNGVLADSELYDPGTALWTTLSPLNTPRFDFTATLLPNGYVLVAGGRDSGNLSSAELSNYSLTNPAAWSNTGSMSTPRRHPVATLLPDGLVMESGGYSSFYLSSAELYNWATETWTITGSMNNARTFQGVTLLPNGSVLAAGGQTASPLTISSAEVYDPATGIWTNTTSLNAAREYHTLTLLPNGLALAAAGWDGNTDTYLSSAELYNPQTGTWTYANPLNYARENHTATLLSNGMVLAAAGANSSGSLNTAELYDPANGAWTETGSLNIARAIHTATMLTNGSVLVVGGVDSSGNALASAEVYNAEPTPWTATANVTWLHLSPADQSGTGGTNVVFSFDPNPGATRIGTLTIAGLTLTVTQAQTTDYALGTNALFEGAAGGSDNVELTLISSVGTWTVTGPLNIARYNHSAALLSNGLVLVSAGENGSGALVDAEIYDPNAGTWTTTLPQSSASFGQPATLLPDGNVLVEGGNSGGGSISTAELYTYTSSGFARWSNTGPLNEARRFQTATLLPDGLVLVAGGYDSTYLSSAELYYSESGTWTNTGSMSNARTQHQAILLSNGLVLVAGGQSEVPLTLSSSEIYNPATQVWTNTASLNTPREYFTLTLLPDGLALAAAGWNGDTGADLSSAELYNPEAGTWTNAGLLNVVRQNHTATLLSSGMVLAAGGVNAGGALTSAELYDPAMDDWTLTGSLNYARSHHTATMLANGSVLVVGGVDSSGNSLASAEVYNAQPSPWTATANVTWLHLSAADESGTGNTNIVFSFDPNPGATRIGTLTVAGLTLTITQAGTTSATLGAATCLEGPTAGVDSVVLAVDPNFAVWTAAANSSWLHLSLANQGGTGSTNVVFGFDANTGGTRTGTITIAGQTLTVTQAGSTYVAAGLLTSLVDLGQHTPYSVAVDVAGNVYFVDSDNDAILTWMVAENTVLLRNLDVLEFPQAVTVDGAGNIYFADGNDSAIYEWTVGGNIFGPGSAGFASPAGLAVDTSGNVYIADTFNNAIKEWLAANRNVITLVSNGLSYPYGVAVDAAGNVYIADTGNNAIKVWTPAYSNVTTLVSGLNAPEGVAVDGSGKVYIADSDDSMIKEWTAASGNLMVLASLGSSYPSGVAVDGTGNVYFAQSGINAIEELPRAFVDPTPKLEGAAAGFDSLPVVLPGSENLLPPFAPTSDQSWLTITGVTNDVLSFSFSADTGQNRTAHITLLGQEISVTQGVIGDLPMLINPQLLGNGVLRFAFSNTLGSSFAVLSTTNLALPLSYWTVVGTASNIGPGQFQFTTPPTTNDFQRFYGVRSP